MDEIINRMLQGDLDAQMYIARCYLDGIGLQKDPDAALFFAKDASDKGSSWADFFLGRMYYYGYGIEVNYKSSFRHYKKAVKDFPVIYLQLGHMYFEGIGIKKNESKAFKSYVFAVEKNVMSGYFFIGQCYDQGVGVGRDISKALHYYGLASSYGLRKSLQGG
jgi:TPR repeat protein